MFHRKNTITWKKKEGKRKSSSALVKIKKQKAKIKTYKRSKKREKLQKNLIRQILKNMNE